MEDVLTEIPPPSRFFQEDLNNFTPPSPPLPTPFLLLSNPKADQPLKPSLLIIALSPPSHFIFNHVSSKTLIGSIIISEIPLSGISIVPSLQDKSCHIYTLNDTANPTILVSVQCAVSAERSSAVAKLLIGKQIIPENVVIFDSVQSQNFRGKLSRDETCAFKLETLAERKGQQNGSPLLKDLEYFPSGSMVDGLSAAILGQCQMKNIRGTLCNSWPEQGSSVVALVKNILQRNVLPGLRLTSNQGDKHIKLSQSKDHPFDSDLYT